MAESRSNRISGPHDWRTASGPDAAAGTSSLDDSVRPVFNAGRVDLVELGQRLTDEVRLEPTPGHTPGHQSVRITSAGEEATITGDVVHHPVQFAEVDARIRRERSEQVWVLRCRREVAAFLATMSDSVHR